MDVFASSDGLGSGQVQEIIHWKPALKNKKQTQDMVVKLGFGGGGGGGDLILEEKQKRKEKKRKETRSRRP